MLGGPFHRLTVVHALNAFTVPLGGSQGDQFIGQLEGWFTLSKQPLTVL
jgi:hypothetical protein